MIQKSELEQLKESGKVPEWLTQEGLDTLRRGYLLPNETVNDAIRRVSTSTANHLNKPELTPLFIEAVQKNWLCWASPIWANTGTERGLNISCNSIHVADSINSIFNKNTELAMLTKHGAGVGIYLGDVRGRGANIKGNGKSDGIIPWIKGIETTTNSVSQRSTRRGAAARYLPIDHTDYQECLQSRRATGDHNIRARNMNIGAVISNNFMEEMLSGNNKNRHLWT